MTTAATKLRLLAQIPATRSALNEAERRVVAALRAEGVPWAQIGAELGVTAQAAQQRFGRRSP